MKFQQDLDVDEVSPDEEDRMAERLVRSNWHTGEFSWSLYKSTNLILIFYNIPILFLTKIYQSVCVGSHVDYS